MMEDTSLFTESDAKQRNLCIDQVIILQKANTKPFKISDKWPLSSQSSNLGNKVSVANSQISVISQHICVCP